MAILRASFLFSLAVALLGACYSPEFPDCRVKCTADTDCAHGQTCNPQNFCAGTETTCPTDASVPLGVDAKHMRDAEDVVVDAAVDAAPDGPVIVVLSITITSMGQVDVSGHGSCGSGTCNYDVPAGVAVTLHAVPGNNQMFENWTDGCAGTDPTCMLIPTIGGTHVTAKFKHDNGHGGGGGD